MTDEIANTMRENALSHEFLLDRVREIIEEHLRSEKELHVENLMQELAALRSELAGAQQQLRAQAQLPHQLQERLLKEAERQALLEQENQGLKEKLAQLATGFAQSDEGRKALVAAKDEELLLSRRQLK